MKSRTSKLICTIWLTCCHVITVPTVGSQSRNNGYEVLEGLSGDLKTLLLHAREVSRMKENLELFYKEWISVTAETLESLNRTRDEILQATKMDNYITLGSAVGAGVGGAVCAATGGLPLLLATIPTFGFATVSVQFLSGTWRYSVSRHLCRIASMYVNTSKHYTKQLNEKMESYFSSMERFKESFKEMRGSDSNLLVLYEIAQSEGFFENLNIDKKTEQELHNLLLQILGIDESKIKPHVWIVDAAEAVVNNVRTILNEIKSMFESDPIALSSTLEQVMIIYDGWRRDSKQFDVPLLDSESSMRYLFELSLKELIETENFVSLCLTALIITGEVVVGTRTAINLSQGSISVESEEILNAIGKMADLRSQVVEKMRVNFGW